MFKKCYFKSRFKGPLKIRQEVYKNSKIVKKMANTFARGSHTFVEIRHLYVHIFKGKHNFCLKCYYNTEKKI